MMLVLYFHERPANLCLETFKASILLISAGSLTRHQNLKQADALLDVLGWLPECCGLAGGSIISKISTKSMCAASSSDITKYHKLRMSFG